MIHQLPGRVEEFDSKSWKDEWTTYFQEAKRFNDDQLVQIFGNSNQTITSPNLDALDNYDRKLYGEFLRRHHHPLAHEIALGGFPTQIGIDNISIRIGDVEDDLIDLAGLIARSHGMPVRKAIDYLETRFQDAWRAPYDIKVVFLMIVLRIADYLQIHSERASKIIIKSKRFESPLSQQEWEKHIAIKDINIKTADPEKIFVIARPENSVIYLELEKLFQDIQAELDLSWAILGETYGRDKELKNLKIKYRRIRSVLDEKKEFYKTINYIPQRIFFNADPQLLKLLIAPLYGDDPKYGIRELLQNSVDAIKEREFLNQHEGKITISLRPIKQNKPRYEIVIADTGIGMSEDTIINYFFKAGASFRKSMAWKKNFTEDKEVKIQKTGRFGVGVLAVFLLGDEFEMWTKYDHKASQGFYCKASLGMTQVELIKQDCPVGTTIRISLKDSVNAILNRKLKHLEEFKNNEKRTYYVAEPDLLDWFTWYLMEKPKIEYEFDGIFKGVFAFTHPNDLISSDPELPSKNWRSFSTAAYKSIHWIFDLRERSMLWYGEQDRYSKMKKLTCNGFKVPRSYKIKDNSYDWTEPDISVFDNNGEFPLGLNRDYIQDDHLPFQEELLENISIEFIEAILKTEFIEVGQYYIPKPNILKFYGEINLSEWIVVLRDEFTILNSSIFAKLKLNHFYQFWIKSNYDLSSEYNFTTKTPYQASLINSDPISFYKPILEYTTGRLNNWFHIGPSANTAERKDRLCRKYISASKLDYLSEGKRLSKMFRQNLTFNSLKNGWCEVLSGKADHLTTFLDVKKVDREIYPLIIESYPQSYDDKDNFFMKTWAKLLDNEWTFPIDVRKRPDISKFKAKHTKPS